MAQSVQHETLAPRPDDGRIIAQLSALHAEAEETAQLARLPGRTVPLTVVIALMTGAATAFAGGGERLSLGWCAIMLLATGLFVLILSRAVDRPIDRDALRGFAGELDATLIFAGLAWGAGAFLIVPAQSGLYVFALFAAMPGVVTASLLRDFKRAILILAPSTVLTALACVLRSKNIIACAFVLTNCGVVASISYLLLRSRSKSHYADASLHGHRFS